MENPAKETVIIVHGTWASPKPDHLSWYQIPDERQDNFVSKLNNALEKRGSPARCWRHCKDNSEIFSWSGENTWIDRTPAAFALAAHINELQANGWRCHVVAHSHGGNVVAEALPQLQAPPAVIQTIDQPTGLSGTITTLGTPFIDPISPIAKQIARRTKLYNLVAWSVISLVLALWLWIAYSSGGDAITFIVTSVVTCVICAPAAIDLLGRRHKVGEKMGWNEYWIACAKQHARHPLMLAISSPMDEAWQVLHHIGDIPNPLAPKSGPISYVWRSRRDYIRRSCAIERIQGVRSFYSAMAAPFRWAARQLRASSRIFYDIGTYVALRRSWSLLQEKAFGLDGYRFELPKAEREPTLACPTFYKYEDLPENVRQRALSNRDEWIRRNFGAFTETFSKIVVTASDLSSLLRIVETDLSLVHASYYTDDECIERIADWIAGKPARVEVEGVSSDTVRLAR
jgi:hypothetical protein